ncbi:MAG: ATP-binding protein [Cytophagaceae bacterium]|jgi:nitrogen-specific signal transduction histidine kinase|nr:ATP-binding protein [Cytophagaceae bacterium]
MLSFRTITEDYAPEMLMEKQLIRFMRISWAVCGLYVVSYAISGLWLLTFVLSLSIALNLVLYFLFRTKKINIAVTSHVFVGIVVCTGLLPGILYTGGLKATGVFWLAFPPMVIQMIRSKKKESIIWLGISIICVGILFWCQEKGITFPYILHDRVNFLLDTFITYLGLFYITIIFATSFLQREVAAREFLETSSTLLHTSNKAAKIALWDYDPKTLLFHWDTSINKTYGLDENFNEKPQEALQFLHSDYSNHLIQESLANAIQHHTTFNIVIDLNTPAGTSWMKVLGKPEIKDGVCEKIIGIAIDITTRKEQQLVVEKATKLAEKANKSKSDFIAYVSHELRTPLNAVIGYSNLLLDEKIEETNSIYLKRIHQASFEILFLIDAVLDLSKIEAQKFTLDMVQVDIRPWLERIVLLASTDCSHLRISYTVSEGVPTQFMMDVERMNQVLYQLISNAVKFTASGSVEVGLSLQRKPDQPLCVRFEVRDTGIGIEKEFQNKIFDLFEYHNSEALEHITGTGIGLTITKAILLQMGISIHLESEPGKGSLFYFDYPIATHSTTPSLWSTKTYSFLILEDDAISLKLLRIALSTLFPGSTIVCCTDAHEASHYLSIETFDVLITDWYMPVVSGAEFIRKLREHPLYSTLKVLVISGQRMDPTEVQGLQIDAWILKPFDKQKLSYTLENLFN